MSIVVFDCESDGRPRRVPGKDADFSMIEATCVCALTLDPSVAPADDPYRAQRMMERSKRFTFWRDESPTQSASPFEGLFQLFDAAQVIVGYNQMDFDFPLLRRYYATRRRYVSHRAKSLDIFANLRTVYSRWFKLDNLLKENGLASKTSDGAEAVRMWESGEREMLESYCMSDVALTAQLSLLTELRADGVVCPHHLFSPLLHLRLHQVDFANE